MTARSRPTAVPTNPELVSYQVLRRVVGLLGIFLPVVLGVGGLLIYGSLENSISDYYATPLRDVFVGLLFVIGWFLYTYHGYDDWDNRIGNAAGLMALGVALFPAISPHPWIRVVHFSCATILFLLLAYFSMGLFTKTASHVPPTPRKLIRNQIYRICGALILASIALLALFYVRSWPAELYQARPVFWLESIALWAFGFSWFVKSEAVLADHINEWEPLARL